MRTAPTYGFSSSEAGATLACTVDGAATPCSSPHTVAIGGLADGSHTFAVSATDDVGNVSAPQSRTFVLDRAAAEPGIAGLSNGTTTNDPTPSVTFSHGEAGTTYRCSIDSTTLASCGSSFTQSTVLPDGPHTLRVQAVDDLGNESTVRSLTFTVDTVAPTAPAFTSGPAEGSFTNDATPTFAYTASDGGRAVTFRCSVDSTTLAGCGSSITPTLTDGQHVFRVQTVDGGGNTSAVVARTFTIDTIAPATSILGGPASGARTADTTPTYTLGGDEQNLTFRCQIDTGVAATCTSSFPPPRAGLGTTLGRGTH